MPASIGDAAYFTGTVEVGARFQRLSPARLGGGIVTFAPGARTAWHTHPLGQTLIVTQGHGWVPHWRDRCRRWPWATWCGYRLASSTGTAVNWLEHVADDSYPR